MSNQTKKILQDALKGGYAIPAFNINNLETLQGVVNGAFKAKSSVFAQVSEGGIKHAGLEYLVAMIKASVATAEQCLENEHCSFFLPILHLDHGRSFDVCKQAIDAGFDSVMIDASDKPFEENVKITKKVVGYAHSKDVCVEAELGRLAGSEDDVSSDKSFFTDPKEAKEFVEKTDCDSLAVSIGTSHGAYKFEGEPFLDFERLSEIEKQIPNVPFVLHGASEVLKEYVSIINKFGGQVKTANGLSEDLLRKAAKTHICKVNCDTDVRLAFTAAVRRFLTENQGVFDYRKYLGEAKKEVEKVVVRKCGVLRSMVK